MEGDNGNKVKIHNLLDMNGQDIINCDNIRPQGTSLHLLSQSQAGGIRISNTLVDVFTDMRMNGNKISFVGTPTAGTDAVNKTYVDNLITGGETIRYLNQTFNNFNPTGTANTFIVPFTPIPDGDYYMDINVTLKYLSNNANADNFNMVVHPNYVVNPSADFDYGTNLKLNNVSISSSNNTFGSVNLKWYDTRTSVDNNDDISITLIYSGGGALNFDVNIRGIVKKI